MRVFIELRKIYVCYRYSEDKEKELAVELKKILQLNTDDIAEEKMEEPKSRITNLLDEDDVSSANESIPDELVDAKVADEILKDISKDSITSKSSKSLNTSSESDLEPPIITDWIPPALLRKKVFDAVITYVDYEGYAYFRPDTYDCA